MLDVIFDEKLQENAHIVGLYLKSRLDAMREEHRCIRSIRGCGLFLGIELRDGEDQTIEEVSSPAPTESKNNNERSATRLSTQPLLASFVVTDMFENHRVISSRDSDVIKIKPPLVFSMQDADILLHALDQSIRSYYELSASSDAVLIK